MKLRLFLLLIIFSACEKKEEPDTTGNKHIKPVFVTTLNPIDDPNTSYNVSKNVIQGIAHFENIWFTAQKSGSTILLINILNENGTSLFHKRMQVESHGQDLSVEQIAPNKLYLYTSVGSFDNGMNSGVLKLEVILAEKINNNRDWSQTNISIKETINLNYSHATPTINEEKDKFAIRSNNTILIHDKNTLSNQSYLNRFSLNDKQLKDNKNYTMWFQGIAMKNDIVYCLTGNDKLDTEKKIFSYNLSGITKKMIIFDINDLNKDFNEKLEPEGLSFFNNHLYFTIMTKQNNIEGNIKYLYRLP